MANSAPGQNEIKQSFTLFYSKRCGESQKFISLLHEYPHINACFQKLDVESLYQLGKLPPQVTYTPGVVDGNQLILGPNAFKWLKSKTIEIIDSAPRINPKGGFDDTNFSFIDEPDSSYKSGQFAIGSDASNGINIDPTKFDSKNGQPVSQDVTKSSKLTDSDMQSYMASRDQGIEIKR